MRLTLTALPSVFAVVSLPLALMAAGCTNKTDTGDTEPTDTGADLDRDGYDSIATGGEDCDDTDETVHPGAEDTWYDGVDSDCSGGSDYDQDADGVDAAPSGADCDDTDPAAFPGAVETCDGVDNDCDGSIDNDAADAHEVYPDDDGDGYGRSESLGLACEAAPGQALDSGDCNDGDPAVSPGADEVCNGVDDDCDTFVDNNPTDGATYYPDFDGDSFGDDAAVITACEQPDSYVEVGGDCDDADNLSYTGASELCDGRDNDCDGTVDEDATIPRSWYPDADGDGYGTDGTTVAQCAQPDGYAGSNDDCDDANPTVHPDAVELCDGLDNDCDGELDADSPDAVAYHPDADADGYGASDVTVRSCTALDGYTTDASDCLDADATVNPLGTEACDGLDNNCDGTTDPNGAAGSTTFYADADEDGYGTTASTLDACSVPAGYSSNDDDCDDATIDANPGHVELCDGIDNDCDADVDEASAADVTTFYADDDADSYGSPTDTTAACSAPAGYLSDNTDCDDTDADIHPTAPEAENAVDDDCDILVDEDFIAVGDIVVDEVARQPYTGGEGSSSNVDAQWFEVHNTTGSDIDLSGWHIEEQDGDSFYISPDAGLVVAAGGYAVLCYADTWFATPAACDYTWGDASLGSPYFDTTFYFDRDEDLIALYLDGALMDSVHWYYDATNGYWPRTARYSMRLDDNALSSSSNDDDANWCLSDADIYSSADYTGYPDYGTPGTANGSCD